MSIFKLSQKDQASTIDIHHDFEFVDCGLNGLHVISIGAVIDGPKKRSLFYGINNDFFNSDVFLDMVNDEGKLSEKSNNTWMFENVFKHIICRVGAKTVSISDARLAIAHGRKFSIHAEDQKPVSKPVPTVVVGTPDEIKEALLKVVSAASPAGETTVRPWGYYTAHDHVCLANLFGGMRNMPDNWCYFSLDIRQMSDIFGQDHDDFNPNTPHHPLYDAVAQYKTARKLAVFVANADPKTLGNLVKGATA